MPLLATPLTKGVAILVCSSTSVSEFTNQCLAHAAATKLHVLTALHCLVPATTLQLWYYRTQSVLSSQERSAIDLQFNE
jgi:hypothetical protein